MGLTYVKGTVGITKRKQKTLEFLIDSGAKYTLLPEPIWRALKLKPQRQMKFVLADGTQIERGISECFISLPQG